MSTLTMTKLSTHICRIGSRKRPGLVFVTVCRTALLMVRQLTVVVIATPMLCHATVSSCLRMAAVAHHLCMTQQAFKPMLHLRVEDNSNVVDCQRQVNHLVTKVH